MGGGDAAARSGEARGQAGVPVQHMHTKMAHAHDGVAGPKGGGAEGQWAGGRCHAPEVVRRGRACCVQACEEADAALRKRLGRRLRKLDRKMDDGFQEALARLQAVCTELDGARRPIDWDD